MRHIIMFYMLFVLTYNSTKAQAVNWVNLNSRFDYGVRTMCFSSTYNKLFVGGNFTYCDESYSSGIVSYDTTGWASYGNLGCNPFLSIIEYQGNVYASCGEILKWDSNTWTSFVTFTWPTNQGAVFSMEVYNNELYVGGGFDTISGVPAKSIAKWDGTTWYNLNFWDNGISAVLHYNGDLYVGGSFRDSLGNVMNIARYDGTQWHDVGGGLTDFVTCMAVYNGELYVGGYFTQAGGNVGNKIQKWNGTSWSPVGTGMPNGQVDALKVFNGELYAGGSFYSVGGLPATKSIAKWNGTQWCSLGSVFDNSVLSLEVFNGDLYVGGGFWTIDGDSLSYIAKWVGGSYSDTCSVVGIDELNPYNSILQVYPNPVSNNLTIEISSALQEKKELSIYNTFGEKNSNTKLFFTKTIHRCFCFGKGCLFCGGESGERGCEKESGEDVKE